MKPFARAPWQIEQFSAYASAPAEASPLGAAATGEAGAVVAAGSLHSFAQPTENRRRRGPDR